MYKIVSEDESFVFLNTDFNKVDDRVIMISQVLEYRHIDAELVTREYIRKYFPALAEDIFKAIENPIVK